MRTFFSSVFSLISFLQILAAAVAVLGKIILPCQLQSFFYRCTGNADVQPQCKSQIIWVCTYFVTLWLRRHEALVFSHIRVQVQLFLLTLTQALFFPSELLSHVKVQSEIATADHPWHYLHFEQFCTTWFISSANFRFQCRMCCTLNVARQIVRVSRSEWWISTPCSLLFLPADLMPCYTQ